jgi:hypothetical protein
MFSELIAMLAEMWLEPAPALLSKKTSSALVGTDALLGPPLEAAQLVGLVEAQVAPDPPPTQ